MTLFDRPMDELQRALVAEVDVWIVEQARIRGMTVEALAERYELEYEPVSLHPAERDWCFRARLEVRLRRRDMGAT